MLHLTLIMEVFHHLLISKAVVFHSQGIILFKDNLEKT